MFKHTIAALAVLGAGVFGMSSMTEPAHADKVVVRSGNNGGVVKWRDNPNGNRIVYNAHRDGIRCMNWRNDCRYRYGRYYYANPWWTLPVIGAGVVIGSTIHHHSGSRHVEWCMDHYRSYNVRTNTWVSYSGEVRQCVSPYRY